MPVECAKGLLWQAPVSAGNDVRDQGIPSFGLFPFQLSRQFSKINDGKATSYIWLHRHVKNRTASYEQAQKAATSFRNERNAHATSKALCSGVPNDCPVRSRRSLALPVTPLSPLFGLLDRTHRVRWFLSYLENVTDPRPMFRVHVRLPSVRRMAPYRVVETFARTAVPFFALLLAAVLVHRAKHSRRKASSQRQKAPG